MKDHLHIHIVYKWAYFSGIVVKIRVQIDIPKVRIIIVSKTNYLNISAKSIIFKTYTGKNAIHTLDKSTCQTDATKRWCVYTLPY